MLVHWYWIHELIGKAKHYQERTKDKEGAIKHELGKNIPNQFEQYDYYDKKFLEAYVCNHTWTFYLEQDTYDASNYPVWSE